MPPPSTRSSPALTIKMREARRFARVKKLMTHIPFPGEMSIALGSNVTGCRGLVKKNQFCAGAHPGTPGSFVVLKFHEPTDQPVVYIETMAGDLYPESQKDISSVILAFDRLRAMGLGPDDSAKLIQQAAKELT